MADDGVAADDLARRPWLRLWIAFGAAAPLIVINGVGARTLWGVDSVLLPPWTAVLFAAPVWFLIARRVAWRAGIPNLWSAGGAVLLLYAGVSLFELATLLAYGQDGFAGWLKSVPAFLFLGALLVAPMVALIGGAWRRWFARDGRPWFRLLMAYVAIVAVGHLIFSSSNWIQNGSTPDVAALRRILAILIAALPVYLFMAARGSWKRGIPDYWAAAIAAAFVNVAALALMLAIFSAEDPNFLRDNVWAFVVEALLTLSIGSAAGGAIAYAIARPRGELKEASALREIETLPRHASADRRSRQRDLAVPVRVRERLDVVNALAGSVYALVVFLLLFAAFMFASTALRLEQGLQGPVNLYPEPAPYWEGVKRIGIMLLAIILLSALLYLISFVHRRWVAAAGAIFCAVAMAYAAWRVLRFWAAPTAGDDPGVRLELTTLIGVGALVTWIVYGALFAAFTGLALVSREDFLAGRGWRPVWRRLVSGGRRLFGMPNYVGALGGAQVGVTALFLMAAVLSAGFVAAPFIAAAPSRLDLAHTYALPAAIEYQVGFARAACSDYAVSRPSDWISEPDATKPQSEPLTRCVSGNLGRVPPLMPIVLLSTFAAVALFGLIFGRAAQRSATRAYQRVRDWDERPLIVYLRAFRADQVQVPARPHGLLPRIVVRPGAPRTLDEIVLDVASPFGPVVAIGRPDEELPPLGAARIYPAANDWQTVVAELCDAAAAVIICLDVSEGVNWELQQMLLKGQEQKVVVLMSPQLSAEARRQLAARVFGSAPNVDVIGGYVEPAGNVVLTAPNASRAAFRVALGLGLANAVGR